MRKKHWKPASFTGSYPKYTICPEHDKKEIAFIGRSNVGKSSLINALLDRKSLAKTSSTPGKTQQINLFNINDIWYLVDLPGYGWAKVSKTKRAGFGDMIQDYILNRKQLACVFVLIDINIPPQQSDLEFIEWLGIEGIPFGIVFTKADRKSKNKNDSGVNKFKNTILKAFESIPPMFVTSSDKKAGLDELKIFIDNVLSEEV